MCSSPAQDLGSKIPAAYSLQYSIQPALMNEEGRCNLRVNDSENGCYDRFSDVKPLLDESREESKDDDESGNEDEGVMEPRKLIARIKRSVAVSPHFARMDRTRLGCDRKQVRGCFV